MHKFNSCTVWLEMLSEVSAKNARLQLSLFCRFANTDPDTILSWTNDKLKQTVLEYIVYLKKNAKRKAEKGRRGEISVNSIRTYVQGVQSFLDFHDRALNWKKFYKYLPERMTTQLRAYTREEVKKMLDFADPRERVLVLIMSSGGVRRGAFETMKFGDIVPIGQYGIGLLKVYSSSDRSRYVTLLTPEAMDAVETYKKWRQEKGEKITADSPLVRDKFDVFSKRRNMPEPLKPTAVHKVILRLARTSGIVGEDLAPNHSFRYFFNTTLTNLDVSHDFKRVMMGHRSGLESIYYKADMPQSREKLLQEYLKAVDALTINEEFRLKREVATLKQELDSAPQKDQVASLLRTQQEQQREIKMLKDWIAGKLKPGWTT